MHTLPNLPPAIAREVFASLCDLLPPPSIDTAEARDSRDNLAMAAVAALHPADALEADLAVQIVAANACAKDSIRLAKEYRNDVACTLRCRAQAASMMRQMQSGLRQLLRIQSDREKAEAAMHPAAMERAGWWWRDASVATPEPPVAEGASEPEARLVEPPPADPFSSLTEAEQYAVLYPDRAARIRAASGLPASLDFGPPEPDIVAAIVNGASPILRALDQPGDPVRK